MSEQLKFKSGSSQEKVYNILKDKQWHCRGCDGTEAKSGQYAGGGGIQGLERGTKSRLGLVIETKQDTCPKCTKKTKWDRWTGETQTAAVTSSIPEKLQKRIFELYKYTDVIEQRKREAQKLIIDHRFPMNRWGGAEDKNPSDMEEEAIRAKFQLLKKDDDGNHNLLKSRACEKCVNTGHRGQPFGIPYWYEGSANWDKGIPSKGSTAEAGCKGCGWYNFEAWRKGLITVLTQNQGESAEAASREEREEPPLSPDSDRE